MLVLSVLLVLLGKGTVDTAVWKEGKPNTFYSITLPEACDRNSKITNNIGLLLYLAKPELHCVGSGGLTQFVRWLRSLNVHCLLIVQVLCMF